MESFDQQSPVSPAPESMGKVRRIHRLLSKPSLQLLVVVVGILTTAVTAYGMFFSGQGAFFLGTRAQSIAKTLALSPGESGLVTCAGKLGGSWIDPLTRRQLRVDCARLANQTPAPSVKPTATAQPNPSTRPTTIPGVGSTSGTGNTSNTGSGVVAASFGIWDPVADPSLLGSGPIKYPTCPKSLHDQYYVIANDGKKYPTWHPPVVIDPATGSKCTFGHEHGRDPSKSYLWPQIKQYFYYDANHNNSMDPEEEKVAGVPFGYANEQLDIYSQSKGIAMMRHEDHVGNKVEWVNGEADMGGGVFNSDTTGGVVIPIQRESNGFKWTDSGAKCYYFGKMHQGVHSKDALTNNLHEMIFFADCKGPTAAYDQKVAVVQMAKFGAPGEFINGCDAEGDRTTPVVLGKDAGNQNWPGTRGDGFRIINQRACIERNFLVPPGKFSMNMYEAWAMSLSVKTPTKTVLSGVNVTLDVEESIRHYDPSKPNGIGYNVDLCYETLPNGNKARGGACDTITQYGKIKDIKWNDVRSEFRDIHRGMYYQGPRLFNEGGPEVWYSDPFGTNAQTTPFPGSIKQLMSSKNVDYLKLGPIDPRVTDRVHDDGEGTVHAPN